MINIRLGLAFFYLGNNVIVWNILKKQTNNTQIILNPTLKEEKNETHTFLDDDEYMQLLRFYRPM